MASNGSFNTSAYSNRYLTFSWVEKSRSIEKNTTTISWTLKGGGSASGFYYTQNVKVKIAGEVVFNHTKAENGQIKLYNGTTVASGTYTFTHDAEGKKDFQVYVEAGIYVWEPNCTGTKTFTLDTIPRASTLEVSDGTLGESLYIEIKRASSNFKHRLTFHCGDRSEYIVGPPEYITGSDYVWTPPVDLAYEDTDDTFVQIKLTLYTYTSDGTHVGTTSEIIRCVLPTDIVPKCSILWEDATNMTEKYGNPVQGLSKLKISLETELAYGSKIATYSATADGVKYTKPEFTTDVLKNSGTFQINATVKDYRGRSGAAFRGITVLAYTMPVVSLLTVHRCNADGVENDQGDHVKVTFSAAVTNLKLNMNPPSYKIRYKAAAASSFTTVELTELTNVYTVEKYDYIFAADGNSSYDVEVVAQDNHGTATRATSASTAYTLMNCHKSGRGMGIGKVSEKEGYIEFGMDADFQGEVIGKVYGLGALEVIPENADLNDYLMPGVYAVGSNAKAETIKNMPMGFKKAGRLVVSAATGGSIRDDSKWRYLEQRYIPYDYADRRRDHPAYLRYISQDGTDEVTYQEWHSEMLKAYPIGSIHLRYDTQNPADLFGGTWVQITARVLRAGSAGSIGAEGTIADGSGRTYIDIAVWRRTA